MSKHLSNSERLWTLEEYLSDSFSKKYVIQKKYGLSLGCIYTWLRKLGLYVKVLEVNKKSKETVESRLSLREQEELTQLRKGNHLLKLELRKEQQHPTINLFSTPQSTNLQEKFS